MNTAEAQTAANGQTGMSLVKRSGGLLVLRGIQVVLGLVITVVLTRALGVDGYGQYALVLAWVSVLVVPVRGGWPELALREAAAVTAGVGMREFLLVARRRIVLAGLLISAFALIPALAIRSASPVSLWVISLPLLTVIALTGLRQSLLRGLGEVWRSQLPEYLVKPVVQLGLLFSLLMWSHNTLTPTLAIAVNAVSVLAAFLVGGRLLASYRVKLSASSNVGPDERRRWELSARHFFLGALATVVGAQAGKMATGAGSGTLEVGIFALALQFSSLGGFFLASVNAAIAPSIVRAHRQGDRGALQKMAGQGATLSTVCAAVYFCLLVLCISYISDLLRVSSEVLLPVLLVLIIGQLLNAITGPCGMLLNMMGDEARVARVLAIANVGQLLVALCLSPWFGALGAAAAYLASIAIWNVILARRLFRKFGVVSLAFVGLRSPA